MRRASDRSTPIVTYAIMGVCAVVWLGQMFIPGVTEMLWYAPAHSDPRIFEPWRLVTSIFTHSTSGFFHILFNMYALFLFGRNLEHMLGRGLYLLLYIVSGIGGSIAVQLYVYVDPGTAFTPTVGASGAIFGLLAATLVVYRRMNINITGLAVVLGLNLLIGFLPGMHISWQAHLGGMIVGAIAMLIIVSTAGPRKRAQRTLGLVLLSAALIVLAGSYFIVHPAELLGG